MSESPHHFLHPAAWKTARGYANGVAATGTTIYVGGMIGWNAEQEFETDEFVGQSHQALQNIVDVLAEGGARPAHLVRLTWFVVSRTEYLANLSALGDAYREVIGRHYPAMTLVQVVALAEDRARLEIEATAVIPATCEGNPL